MKKKVLIVISILVLLLFGLSFYLYNENTKLDVTNYYISDSRIKDEIKIIQVSDFHNNKYKRLTKSIIDKIKEYKPDYIFLTGDLVDARRTDMDTSIKFVKDIKDVSDIYYVTGNHEESIDESDKKELITKLEELGVKILNSENEYIKDRDINIIGISDPFELHEAVIMNQDIVKSKIDMIDFDRSKFTILLSHRPELFNCYVEKNIDLVFSGHAHGGQIRLPFIGGVFAPHQGMFPGFTNGIKKRNKTNMIISRGIGNSVFPWRVNNKPELVIAYIGQK